MALAGIWGGVLFGVLVLILALHLIVTSAGPISLLQFLMVFWLSAAFIFSGWLIGLFLGKYVGLSTRTLSGVCAVVVWALGFDVMLNYFEVALTALDSPLKYGALLVSSVSSVLACAGTVAVVVMVAALSFELPFRWWLRGFRATNGAPLPAIRLLAVIVIMSLSVNQVLAVVLDELNATALIKLTTGKNGKE